jgi:4-alpha-glucanotransferase
MLRIDHVMGLWRQFWVPDGLSPREGAYVQYPASELLGILALESTRAGSLVVGEDLGNVPDYVRPELAARSVLSSKVLYFEREQNGHFLPPESYEPLSLASVNTHDLPTMAGWWIGADILARHARGSIELHGQLNELRLHRVWERNALVAELLDRGLLSESAGEQLTAIAVADGAAGSVPGMTSNNRAVLERLVRAVHQYLAMGSSLLVSLALDDLALELEPVNRPGVPPEEYPNWSRKMGVTLQELIG